MDRRTALAIGLMLVVALLPSLLFSPKRPTTRVPPPDSLAPVDTGLFGESPRLAVDSPSTAPPPDGRAVGPERFVTVVSPLYEFVFSTRGARLIEARLSKYTSFASGDSGRAQLLPLDSR